MIENYETQILDHLGIVAGICEEIELIREIDELVPKRDSPVSVGQAVQAMVVNALGFVSRPLYLNPEFFRNKPIDLLVGEGIEAEQLDDNCLGRSLDRLFEAGITEVFASIALKALKKYEIEVEQGHLDSTSFGLHGEYEEETDENLSTPIKITHGYSRDRRPDLKQAMLGLITANASNIPVWLVALDGNSSDQTQFRSIIQAYLQQFGEEEETPIMIADAALYTHENLVELSETSRWITRVPGSLSAVQELYRSILPEDMLAIDDETRFSEGGSYYGGIKQRWILVYHEPTRYKRDQSLHKRIEKEQKAVQKAFNRLSREQFVCEGAAWQAVKALTNGWSFHQAQIELSSEERYDKPGRPRSDEKPQTIWRMKGQLIQDSQRIEAAKSRHGKYVIATNVLDEDQLSATQMLAIYKEQSTTVERGFRFLKDPLFFAHSLFLKKPSRIMALMMIMGLSLLIYSLAEHILRQQMAQQQITIPDQKGWF